MNIKNVKWVRMYTFRSPHPIGNKFPDFRLEAGHCGTSYLNIVRL